jgi:hypothetical protein
MPSIRHIKSEQVFAVSETPRFVSGIWECGDQRFIDPDGTEYEGVVEYELLTPMTLYMAFTPVERMKIKASEDPLVKEFWEMYQLSVQLGKPTDPNLPSVQNAIAYLARPAGATPPGAGILESPERIEQILLGIPQ